MCNFHGDISAFITGAACPLFFVMARQILPKLCPMLGGLFCNHDAETVEEVQKAMSGTFTR
jgi:hypothetical protein